MMSAASKVAALLSAGASTEGATYYATSSVSGNVSTPANALSAPDGTYTTDTGKVNWTHRWQIAGSPSATPSGTQTLTIRARKDAAAGGAPTVDSVTIYYGGASHHADSTGWTPSDTGTDIGVSFSAPAGNTIDVEIATTGNGGGPNERSIQVDGMTWSATVESA